MGDTVSIELRDLDKLRKVRDRALEHVSVAKQKVVEAQELVVKRGVEADIADGNLKHATSLWQNKKDMPVEMAVKMGLIKAPQAVGSGG